MCPPNGGKTQPALSLWMDAKEIAEKIGLPEARLREFYEADYVRSAKFGDSRQAARKYHRPDVEQALLRIASGYEPHKKRKTP